jgi:hypothetical protein
MEEIFYCANHPQKIAKRHCYNCKKDLCNECVFESHIDHYKDLTKIGYATIPKISSFTDEVGKEIRKILSREVKRLQDLIYKVVVEKTSEFIRTKNKTQFNFGQFVTNPPAMQPIFNDYKPPIKNEYKPPPVKNEYKPPEVVEEYRPITQKSDTKTLYIAPTVQKEVKKPEPKIEYKPPVVEVKKPAIPVRQTIKEKANIFKPKSDSESSNVLKPRFMVKGNIGNLAKKFESSNKASAAPKKIDANNPFNKGPREGRGVKNMAKLFEK